MQSRATPFDVARNGTVGRGGHEQFHFGIPGLEERREHSLVLHLFTFVGAHPQNVLKNPLRLLQIRHGNAKVFQSLHGTKIGLPTFGHMSEQHVLPMDLSGKRALVCGASQGIGLAAAQQLAGLGASVTLLARNQDRLNEALATLPGSGHATAVADFLRPEDVQSAVADLLGAGDIHILVNNSGGPAGGPITEAAEEAFLATFNQHLINNQILAKAVLPGMQRAGWGRIVNVISTSVKAPLAGLGVSNTIRGAVANWAKTWATEVAIHGITVNNVLPGATHTARLTSLAEAKAASAGTSPEAVLAGMAAKVPAGRVGRPEEIGHAIAFLCSPAAGYISGINLPVDGGRTPSL